ncbi:hypothetical protein ACFW4L_23315, partial [Streptomyces sp. NPDC058832]
MNRPDPSTAEGSPATTASGTTRPRRRWWRGVVPRPRRLRSRLALAASAAVVLVTVGVCTASFFVLRYKLYQQVDQSLAQSATLVAREDRDGEPAV